ncbi:hypothetical protein FB45DRAFT_336065 [Roridomyces roridus]|uniref:Uncharacterized protein n=1 Tax=Roridomyces roridus TaxID=1738132 RepID=A0AAD7B413_9AGAR|nr:hypothetical protein FB45DRAFT_336065 [Roridomyces roridus]
MASGAPLTKRQRQALRRAGAGASVATTPPPSEGSSAPASPPASQPQMGDVLAMVRAREAEAQRQREEDEEERASPSKYPTPLPDDDEEEDRGARGYPSPRTEAEDGVLGAIDMEEPEPLPLGEEPPLVDLGYGFGGDMDLAQTARPRVQTQRRVDRESTIRASSGRRPAESRHGHLRAPELARPPPPRALSALAQAHTRRALAAVTTTAAAAYEAFNAPSVPHSGRRGDAVASPSKDHDPDAEEEAILAARWDEVQCANG